MFGKFLIVLLVVVAPNQDTEKEIPQSFHGVWKIVAAVDEEGVTQERADVNDLSSDFVSKFGDEFLILGNRIVHVSFEGRSVVGYVSVERKEPNLMISVKAGMWDDKEQSETVFYVLKLDEDQLEIYASWDKMSVGNEGAEEQVKMTATRNSR